MESVKKAHQRFRNYPILFAECKGEAAVYANCVLKGDNNIKKDECAKEFGVFKKCIQNAALKHKTKL